MVVESMVTSPSLPMMTLVPDRVSVSLPGRPVLTGITLRTWPPRRTVIVCAAMSTVETVAEPTVKLALSSLPTHLSGPVCRPVRGALTVTVVPGFQ